MALQEAKARRLIAAVLASMDEWYLAVAEIEAHANPGNKLRSLHLMRNLAQAKQSLERLLEDAEKP